MKCHWAFFVRFFYHIHVWQHNQTISDLIDFFSICHKQKIKHNNHNSRQPIRATLFSVAKMLAFSCLYIQKGKVVSLSDLIFVPKKSEKKNRKIKMFVLCERVIFSLTDFYRSLLGFIADDIIRCALAASYLCFEE